MTYTSNYTALLSGHYWNPYTTQGRPVILTYSFDTQAVTGSQGATDNPFTGSLDDAHKTLVRAALAAWSANAGITFIETTQHEGDLNFGYYHLADRSAAGDATYPASGSYIAVNGSLAVYSNTDFLSGVIRFDDVTRKYSSNDFTHVALHEIGHALGLKHTFEGDIQLVPAIDNSTYSVMSYTGYAPRLGSLDETAIQAIYGSKTTPSPFAWSWDAATETLTQTGTAANDYIKGTGANDIINTAGGADAVVTYAGNDIIIAYGQSLQVNAGAGLDVVKENLSRSSLTAVQYDQSQKYAYVTFGSANQALSNVERLQFTDGTLALDLSGTAGEAYRLYQAAFDRTPDATGLTFWVSAMDSGKSLYDVAAGFVQSNEFHSVYRSAQSDDAFVSKLYNNILGRDGEPDGMVFWEGKIASGASYASVLAGFSESPENITGVAPSVAHGIWLV